MAVRLAWVLHVTGRRADNRQALARAMRDQPAVRQPWFRKLMREVLAR
jgi:hypothetical protein